MKTVEYSFFESVGIINTLKSNPLEKYYKFATDKLKEINTMLHHAINHPEKMTYQQAKEEMIVLENLQSETYFLNKTAGKIENSSLKKEITIFYNHLKIIKTHLEEIIIDEHLYNKMEEIKLKDTFESIEESKKWFKNLKQNEDRNNKRK